MTIDDQLANGISICPLVAILRGVKPSEIDAIGDALVEAGFHFIEVPLNSPKPLDSIERLAARYGDAALIGAGTVLTTAAVREVASAGGRLIVSPNTDAEVIEATKALGLLSLPGCFTPSEAFTATKAGADCLKYFPAEAMSPAVLKAQCAVLPPHIPKLVVGGITPQNISPWLVAGATGFGLGSALYRAGDSADTVAEAAQSFVRAWRMLGK